MTGIVNFLALANRFTLLDQGVRVAVSTAILISPCLILPGPIITSLPNAGLYPQQSTTIYPFEVESSSVSLLANVKRSDVHKAQARLRPILWGWKQNDNNSVSTDGLGAQHL